MKRTTTALAVATLGAGLTLATAGQAAAAPYCGGQHAAPQPVPYTCHTDVKVIDGTAVSAIVHADGTVVTATYTLQTPRALPTPVRITHHEGISGAGGTSEQSSGVIPPGVTTITLSDSAPCRAGQLDIKFVFVASNQPQGRVGGPWIENGNSRLDIASTVPPVTSPPSVSTLPPTTVQTPGASSPPSAPPGSPTGEHGVSGSLPATGTPAMGLGVLGATIALLGAAAIVHTRRRPA